ncbi:hypothetical protein Tco_0013254 [Tanacetum coccineum]
MVEDLDNYHLKEIRCSSQCHTQKTLWIIAKGDECLILCLVLQRSLEASWKFLFLINMYLLEKYWKRYERLNKIPKELGIQSTFLAHVHEQASSQLSGRKIRRMELEPGIRILALE